MNISNVPSKPDRFGRSNFAADDMKWLLDNPFIPCRIRAYRQDDRKRIYFGSCGTESEKVWLTFVFRSGVYVSDYFPSPSAKSRAPLLDRACAALECHVRDNPDWLRDVLEGEQC